MIELTRDDKLNTDNQYSKGQQTKFCKNGYWYKIDELGYEGLSEVVVSNILAYSNIENYISYSEEEIKYGKNVFLGCKSRNFKKDDQEIVTVSRIYETFSPGRSVSGICREDTLEDSILHLVSDLSKHTKLSERQIGEYLAQIIELDSLTLNDDRHFNNIAFLYSNKGFELCPIFDNGGAFLSDEYHYCHTHFEDDIELMQKTAKPFMVDASTQKEAFENLFGKQFEVNLTNIDNYFSGVSLYPQETVDRVKEIVAHQLITSEFVLSPFDKPNHAHAHHQYVQGITNKPKLL